MAKFDLLIVGVGGQGVILASDIIGRAAVMEGLPVMCAETHGMAQRGGAVISMVKVGPFKGPLIPPGRADVGLFLHAENLEVHRSYLKEDAAVFVNTRGRGDFQAIDARALARQMGAAVAANLILLGFAAAKHGLFCGPDVLEQVIHDKTPARFRDANLQAFRLGVATARQQ